VTNETFTYTDAGGNSAQCTFHVTVGAVLSATLAAGPATCASACDGNASININSAALPYTINWSNGQTGTSLANLCAGPYAVTITDGFGCSQNWSTNVIVQDDVPPVMTCPGNITTSACHNTVNYVFPVVTDNCPVDPAQIQMLSGLAPGSVFPAGSTTQTFSFTDGYGNNTQCSFTVTIQGPPSISLVTESVKCAGHCDGAATLTLTGGYGPFSINWSNGQVGLKANELCNGTYLATITDAAGCSQTAAAMITEPAALSISVDQTTDDTGGTGTGSIQVTVAGGLPPYHYLWTRNGQIFGNTKDLAHLTQGQYILQITDANGCTQSSTTVVINNLVATSTPEWSNGFTMQPNPATDLVRLVFEHPLEQSCAVRVCSATGQVALEYHAPAAGSFVELNTTDLSAGMWIVQLYTADGKTAIRKLMVAR
jgi:hypothetical protein